MMGPASNVPFRFGCTGTVPKEELYRHQIFGTIGPVIFKLQAWELQKAGVLASSEVHQVSLNDRKNPSYVKATPFEDWTDYLNWIFQDKDRMRMVADIIIDVAENYGNTLILVPHRAHGKLLHALIPGSISLDGNDKATARHSHYEEFNEANGAIMICTSAIASTGLDIPRINVLGFIEPGKKFEKIIQTIGRGLRKADDKDHVYLLDIHGNADLAKRHAAERRKLYDEARIAYHIEEIDYVDP
jgi:superfamily II DNA or RNA helicase